MSTQGLEDLKGGLSTKRGRRPDPVSTSDNASRRARLGSQDPGWSFTKKTTGKKEVKELGLITIRQGGKEQRILEGTRLGRRERGVENVEGRTACEGTRSITPILGGGC